MIDEEDLTTERSSKAVNRCIHDLTRGINDGIGRWGEGKNLYMDINQHDLMLIDPVEMTILHKQSIASIRVWGVGRENSRSVFVVGFCSFLVEICFVVQRFCLRRQRQRSKLENLQMSRFSFGKRFSSSHCQYVA